MANSREFQLHGRGDIRHVRPIEPRGRRRALAIVLAVASALYTVLIAGVMSASAADAPRLAHDGRADLASPIAPATTDLTFAGPIVWTYGSWEVDIFWGYDYSPATNHLRAWAEMSSNSGSTHLQAEPLNLGDRNGVLASKFANSQIGFLETETDAVQCHSPNGVYLSNLHYSIRWPDGVLTAGQQTGRFEAGATAICV